MGPLKDIFTLKPTALAKKVFTPELIAKWERSGTGKKSDGSQRLLKVRDIWELTSPPGQCSNTIGSITGKTLCWICGVGVPQKPTKRQIGYAGQCEHILPIAQGVMIWSLYGPKDKTDPNFKSYLKLEYDWAHTVCNQVKSAMILLTPSPDGHACSLNTDKIETLLTKIYNSDRKDSTQLKAELKKTYGTVGKFVANRRLEMERRMLPMVTEINKNLGNWGPKMILLTSAAKAISRIAPSLESIHSVEDIKDALDSDNSPIIIPISPAETQAAPEEEEYTEVVSQAESDEAEAASRLIGLRNTTIQWGGKRRTRRRRHQSIKMSSRRHSLSGKPARR